MKVELASPPPHVMTFGPFTLLPARKLLLDNGKPLRLGSRAFDILTVLVERAGEVLSKEALIAHAWPRTVVEENSLRVNIAALRRVLDKGQAANRYIANVPGRGYCFVAPVIRTEHPLHGAAQAQRSDPTHNLPVKLTRMIGREQALHSLLTELRGRRFISLVGHGGVGKTTLALALAEESLPDYRDGVRFVDLSVLTEPGQIPLALAVGLGMGVQTQPETSLAAHLAGKSMLIVLDNCEHLIAEAANLAVQLLKAGPDIHILTTTREPLRAEGEWVRRIAPLESPHKASLVNLATASAYPAVQLFVERARANDDTFELGEANAAVVSELCWRLDGLPLAIELAAACVSMFGVRELVARLNDRFRLLSSGYRSALPRHQTLRALLDWSHDLLSDGERRALRAVSVFAGSFSLESVATVVAGRAGQSDEALRDIGNLIAKSFIALDAADELICYRMLATTRTYAAEKLQESGEAVEFFRRHADLLVEQLGHSEANWPRMERARWLARYSGLVDEVSVALDRMYAEAGDPVRAIALTIASLPFAHQFSLLDSYLVKMEKARQLAARLDPPRPDLDADLENGFTMMMGQALRGQAAKERAVNLALSQRSSGPPDIVTSYTRWVTTFTASDYAASLRFAKELTEAARRTGDVGITRTAGRTLAQSLHFLGDHAEAEKLAGLVLSMPGEATYPDFPHALDVRVSMRIVLARVFWMTGRLHTALETSMEALVFARQGVMYGVCQVLAMATIPIAFWSGETTMARGFVAQLRTQADQYSLGYWQSWARLFEDLLSEGAGTFVAEDLMQQDMLLTLLAPHVSAASVARVQSGAVGWNRAEVLRARGEEVRANGGANAERDAEALFTASLESATQQGAVFWQLRSALSMAHLWQAQGQLLRAHALLTPLVETQRGASAHAGPDMQGALLLLEQLQGVPNRRPAGARLGVAR